MIILDNQLFGVSRLIITPINDLASEYQDVLAQKANISKIKIQQ
jgi:hypothetical protein